MNPKVLTNCLQSIKNNINNSGLAVKRIIITLTNGEKVSIKDSEIDCCEKDKFLAFCNWNLACYDELWYFTSLNGNTATRTIAAEHIIMIDVIYK